ncbi:DUF6702 family protein [Aliiglaciecola sp. LCG003]|uniref:DUF6702 family protein n=1 Tax=Aliiglaciecola sp. LCG003 TaxID=3053655 RepID=UPI00257317A5|nr:DUF6702 family protein [Aliiglaciecola sp. LCG003]WJG11353.1 hypothetical protein QR722_18915 [Aliiglaciecola sp. LCG003]
MLAVTLVVSAAVSAHQQKTAISTILFNPRTDNIEVMHRFNLHDAEHAVKQIFGKGADILDSTETQLQFSEYVAARFTLFDADNNNLALKKVGFEVDGKFFWVYQETAQIDNLQGIQVKHDALRDLWSSQTNTVNIEGMGDIKTLTFTQNIELLEVSFGHH